MFTINILRLLILSEDSVYYIADLHLVFNKKVFTQERF